MLQTLQKHHHPDVSKAAALIKAPLPPQEDDISQILETTTYQVGLLAGSRTSGRFQDLHHMLLLFSTADGAGTEEDGAEEHPAGV